MHHYYTESRCDSPSDAKHVTQARISRTGDILKIGILYLEHFWVWSHFTIATDDLCVDCKQTHAVIITLITIYHIYNSVLQSPDELVYVQSSRLCAHYESKC